MFQKIIVSDKFKIYIHQRILKNKIHQFPQKYETVFNIDNNQKCFLIKSAYDNDFWRSCDTEDWSNDAENTFTQKSFFYCNISQFLLFCLFLIK